MSQGVTSDQRSHLALSSDRPLLLLLRVMGPDVLPSGSIGQGSTVATTGKCSGKFEATEHRTLRSKFSAGTSRSSNVPESLLKHVYSFILF